MGSSHITPRQFAEFTPYLRGYAVYMCGDRDDQPNVPNERNPYRKGSPEALAWDRGQAQAVLDAQDGDD